MLERLDLTRFPVHAVPEGRWLPNPGHHPAIAFIESGRLDVVVQLGEHGTQVIPVTFEAGELALLSTLFAPEEAHQPSIVTAEPVQLRWLPRNVVETVLLADKELLVLLVQFLSQRLQEVHMRERGWLERSVSGRVRSVLRRVALECPAPEGRPWLISTTHEHLAMRCGVSRPKLSFELKQLEGAGILRLHRGTIELLDYAMLIGGE